MCYLNNLEMGCDLNNTIYSDPTKRKIYSGRDLISRVKLILCRELKVNPNCQVALQM